MKVSFVPNVQYMNFAARGNKNTVDKKENSPKNPLQRAKLEASLALLALLALSGCGAKSYNRCNCGYCNNTYSAASRDREDDKINVSGENDIDERVIVDYNQKNDDRDEILETASPEPFEITPSKPRVSSFEEDENDSFEQTRFEKLYDKFMDYPNIELDEASVCELSKEELEGLEKELRERSRLYGQLFQELANCSAKVTPDSSAAEYIELEAYLELFEKAGIKNDENKLQLELIKAELLKYEN